MTANSTTSALRRSQVAYEECGQPNGLPVFLLHGWPYDPRCYDEVAVPLAAAGCRVVVPYLRGFGPTRFLSAQTPRSGQQAALGNDLRELMDALGIERAVLAGYDWGGRAACIVAALWPERVHGLVTVNGYNIQDIAGSVKPVAPAQEHRFWYQYYFHTERGRAGLEQNRRSLARYIWRIWSPHWAFDDSTFERSAVSFDNPDFVDVTIQSYRHRFGYAPGDPALEPIELQARRPAENRGPDNRAAGRCGRRRAERRRRTGTRPSSPGRISAACCPRSVTTRRRRRRARSPMRSWNWRAPCSYNSALTLVNRDGDCGNLSIRIENAFTIPCLG